MVIKKVKKIRLGKCVKDAFYSSLDDYIWDSIDSIFTFDGTTLSDYWTSPSFMGDYPLRLIITLIDEEYDMRIIIKLFMFNSGDKSIFITIGHQEITCQNNEVEYSDVDDMDLSRILDDYIAAIKDYADNFFYRG